MTLLLILALVALTAVLLLRGHVDDRRRVALVAGVMALGLGGYALAGSPLLPGSPAPSLAVDANADDEMKAATGRLLQNVGDVGAWLTFADAMQRQGRSADAVEGLEMALKAMPDSPDLWVGLGNALTVHGGGLVSPAARLAFDRASQIDPDHPAPPYFLALAWVQAGEPDEAVKVLEPLLARAPADAPWRGPAERLLRGARAMASAGVDGGRFPAAGTDVAD